MAITLHYLKNQGSMKKTANFFEIARCSVGCVKEEVCTLISENIGPSFIISPPEKNVLNATSCLFEKPGFPQVIGCVDGTQAAFGKSTWLFLI